MARVVTASRASRMGSGKRGAGLGRFSSGLIQASSVVFLLVVWLVLSRLNTALGWFPPALFPGPDQVVLEGVQLLANGQLQQHAIVSLIRVIAGFAIGSALGIVLGMLAGRIRFMSYLIEPTFNILRPIPPLAFLPLMILWFGIGEASKVAFIAYTAFFPVFTTTAAGIRFVDELLIRAASSLGANERQLFRHVILPAAFPQIVVGLRLAFSISFFVIVAAEFVAAQSGLGFLINDARTFFLVPRMLLGAAVIGILGFLFNALLTRLERYLLPWRKDSSR